VSEDGNLATAALSTNLTSPVSASSSAAAAVKVTLFYKSFRKAKGLRGSYNLMFNW
jgi:hypothetical protein